MEINIIIPDAAKRRSPGSGFSERYVPRMLRGTK
jgi:hypothetical protein